MRLQSNQCWPSKRCVCQGLCGATHSAQGFLMTLLWFVLCGEPDKRLDTTVKFGSDQSGHHPSSGTVRTARFFTILLKKHFFKPLRSVHDVSFASCLSDPYPPAQQLQARLWCSCILGACRGGEGVACTNQRHLVAATMDQWQSTTENDKRRSRDSCLVEVTSVSASPRHGLSWKHCSAN